MTTADSVATAALVVGLAALVIAAGQLLQQMFSTADGYRRCKRSVIGPWANRTRRVWHWGQFRFETRFTTPEIVLYDWRALQQSKKVALGSLAHAKSSSHEILEFEGTNVPYELQETIRPTGADEDDYSSGDMVSWTSLLRQLYILQSQWYQSYHVNALEPTADTNVVAYATKIGVIYRERTWDLMPPDSIRPMASSRLGTMIVLAIRLGMNWENLNVGEGILRAEGNGHAMISTTIRGMGIVFQYNYNPDMDTFCSSSPQNQTRTLTQGPIPRRSIDMMACGILPGVPSLNIPAIPLKGKNFTETATLFSSALQWLKVSRLTILKIADPQELEYMQTNGHKSEIAWPVHDMVILLSNFQPLRGSARTQMVYPIQTNAAPSIFALPETRRALLSIISKHDKLNDADRSQLRWVHEELHNISEDYSNDFNGNRYVSIVNDPSASYESKNRMISYLRKRKDMTTQYFTTRIEPNLKYAYLVAAHISLAANATRDRVGASPATIAQHYVDGVPWLIEELRTKMDADQNAHISDAEIEDAWWTLMLRGIVWRMSVHFSHQETIVPSRLYYDQTPVFIM